MKVTCEPIQPRNDELGTCGLGVTDCGLKLRAGVALAALDLDVFGHQLPPAAIEIPGYRVPLRLKSQPAATLLVG